MGFLFQFFDFLYLIHQAHNIQKSFFTQKDKGKVWELEKCSYKVSYFPHCLSQKSQKPQPEAFEVEVLSPLQDKNLINFSDF